MSLAGFCAAHDGPPPLALANDSVFRTAGVCPVTVGVLSNLASEGL